MAGPLERPDLRVVARILEVLATAPEPMRPTPLQQAAGTNYSQFERYVELLARRGLIEPVLEGPTDRRWRLSSRGHEAYRFLVEALARVVDDGTGR